MVPNSAHIDRTSGAVWLGIVGPMPDGLATWLQRWQTLVAASVALSFLRLVLDRIVRRSGKGSFVRVLTQASLVRSAGNWKIWRSSVIPDGRIGWNFEHMPAL